MGEHAAQHVCFFMFLDQQSMQAVVRDGGEQREGGWKVGLWRLVLVSNIPYQDPRRTGKVNTMRQGSGNSVQRDVCLNR